MSPKWKGSEITKIPSVEGFVSFWLSIQSSFIIPTWSKLQSRNIMNWIWHDACVGRMTLSKICQIKINLLTVCMVVCHKCFLLMKRKCSDMVTDCKIIKLKKKLDNTSYDLPPVTHWTIQYHHQLYTLLIIWKKKTIKTPTASAKWSKTSTGVATSWQNCFIQRYVDTSHYFCLIII